MKVIEQPQDAGGVVYQLTEIGDVAPLLLWLRGSPEGVMVLEIPELQPDTLFATMDHAQRVAIASGVELGLGIAAAKERSLSPWVPPGCASEFGAGRSWFDLPIAFIDVETTGRDPTSDRIVELGIAFGTGGKVTRRESWLINPGRPIPPEVSAVHGITDTYVEGKPRFEEVASEILACLVGAIPAAYNASFDRGFLVAEMARAAKLAFAPCLPAAVRLNVEWLDPLVFAREFHKDGSRAIGDMTQRLGIPLARAHRAVDDAEAGLQILYRFMANPGLPRIYSELVSAQRQLQREQEAARRIWRGTTSS